MKTALNFKLCNCKMLPQKEFLLMLCWLLLACPLMANSQTLFVFKHSGALTLKKVFNELQKKSDYVFFYQSDVIDGKTVTGNCDGNTVQEVLDKALANKGLSYTVRGKDIVIVTAAQKFSPTQEAKKRTIRGKIIDGTTNEIIIGASVWLKETTIGGITDIDGNYSLSFTGNQQIISVSYLGYKTVDVVLGDKATIDISLFPDSEALDEVVVVGYGAQKKESVVGAIATWKREDMKLPTGKISTNLAGQMAGIVAVSRSGEPGEAGAFYIRGISSFNGASQGVLVLVDGVERSLDGVDPEDIESFSVLKDATATAIYGVRGANGVMLVTTRKGAEGKPQVTARAEFGVVSPTRMPKMVNSLQFVEMVNEVKPGYYSPEDVAKYKTAIGMERNLYPDVNWMDELFNSTATNQRVNLNVSGGGTTARYFISGSFYNEGSIYGTENRNDYNTSINYKRYSFRSNIDVNITPSTVLMVNLSNLYEVKNQPGASRDDAYSGIWPTAFATSPNAFPMYYTNADGSFDRFANGAEGTIWNPYNQLMQSGYQQSYYNSMQSIFSLTQDFSSFVTPGLKANVRFSWDAYSDSWDKRTQTPQTFLATGNMNSDGTLQFTETAKGSTDMAFSNGSGGSRSLYVEASVTYDRIFADKHRVSGLFLYNQREKSILLTGSSILAMPYKNQGIAGRATYSYDDRYFFEGNFGYNGSENFSPGKRFGFFPAMALGWMVSNEKFWVPLSDVIESFKIRGSYGLVGNDQIGGNRRFIYEGTILNAGNQPGYSFGDASQSGGSGIREGDISNANVGWEKSYKTDIGIELTMFRSLRVQADYFNEDRDGIFVQRKGLPAIAGNTNIPWSNVGKMNNKGFDGSVEYNKMVGDFTLSGRGNFTYNYSKVIDNDEPAWKYPYQGANGRKYNQPTGLICLGFFEDQNDIDQSAEQQFGVVRPGDLKYADVNGDGIVDSNDAVPIGNPEMPQISYGFGGSISWKGFDLSLFFQGVGKVSLFTEGNAVYGLVASNIRANGMYEDLYNGRWIEGADNSNARYPRLSDGSNSNNDRRSTFKMHDGSYFRLKNMEIGYSLPKEAIKKVGLKSARVYLSGINLLTFSKFDLWDPEKGSGQGLGYPPNRVFNIGLNLNF